MVKTIKSVKPVKPIKSVKSIKPVKAIRFTNKDAKLFLEFIDYPKKRTFTLKSLTYGMNIELEHGTRNKITNVTNNSLIKTGKIALAHLLEMPDYYERLAAMEIMDIDFI